MYYFTSGKFYIEQLMHQVLCSAFLNAECGWSMGWLGLGRSRKAGLGWLQNFRDGFGWAWKSDPCPTLL